jgi:uncharacterized protein YlxW (UPF0749 family)
MLKKTDYIIIGIICFFLGIFIVSQKMSAQEYSKIIQPENNDVLALEVSSLTKANADLRQEVAKLTSDLDVYQNSSESNKSLREKYLSNLDQYNAIIGNSEIKGHGVIVTIQGNLVTAQVVDLVNAIKNIGSSQIAINGERLLINTDLSKFAGKSSYIIDILGNGQTIKSAMERKGGIVEQISTKDLQINTEVKDSLVLSQLPQSKFIYAKILPSN